MFLDLDEITQQEVLPGFKARFVHAENFTIAYWEIKAGCVLPEHAHIHEQTSQVTEGEFELTIEGDTRICKPGGIAIIPSNALHGGKALTNCKIMDIFYPVREDYK